MIGGIILKIGLREKIIAVLVGILILFGLVMIYIVISQMKSLANENVTDKLEAVSQMGYSFLDSKYPGAWSIKDGNLCKGNIIINNNEEVYKTLDLMKDETDAYFTIFQTDTRVATNVKKADGSRAIGTKQDNQDVVNTVLKESKAYVGDAVVVNIPCVTKYLPIKDNSGKVIGMWFAGESIELINKEVNKSTIIVVIAIILGILFAIAVTVLASHRIVISVRKILEVLNSVGKDNNLSVKTNVTQRDEFGEIGSGLNETIDNIKGVISEVKNAANNVYLSSQKLAKATEESGATMEEVASSISSISKDMMDNLNFIQQATTNVGEVSSSADMVAKSCREVADESRKVRQDAMDGGNSVKQVLVAVNEVASSSKDVENVINELSVLSQKIGEIIEIITGISTQTNLLSLNAAIEAARAGEAGRGFAVVAEEIRKLAAESSEAAKDITNLVIDVQDKTQNAVEKITIGDQKVTEGVKKATDTDEYIQGIVKAIDKVTNEIDRISSAAVQQSEFAKRMNDSMNNILKITETTADSSQQMSAGVQEQTGTFQEIGFVAMELSRMAEGLNELIKRFKLD